MAKKSSRHNPNESISERRVKRQLLAALLAAGITASAQAQSKPRAGLRADFVSTYVWRGLKQAGVSLQPEVAVGWKGLNFSVWGSVALTAGKEDINEIDLTLSYQRGGLSFGIIDYWNDANHTPYFYYKGNTTGHSFEGYAGYDFGPVSVSWQTIFAGNDYQEADGKRAWSSYIQLLAPFRLLTCEWEGELGLVPWASDYYSAKGFRVTNISLRATKAIKITKSFSLPLFVQLIGNPTSEKMYFLGGFTLKAL